MAAEFSECGAAKSWLPLVAVAVLGSCFYGGSLAAVLPGWTVLNAALWLALSAGLAWGVFIPALCHITRLPFATCFHACLIAMAGGEVVLCSGAGVNFLLGALQVTAHAAPINLGIVAISNVAMLILLAAGLRRHGVAPIRTTALWMLGLNGTGALFFTAFFHLLHRV
jgi:hypothetical protein